MTVDTPSGPALGKAFLATLDTDQVLKGNPGSQRVHFQFSMPDAPSGYRPILQGQYGIFFLKRLANSELKECDPFYPFLPAVPGGPVSSGSPLDQVAAKLGEVLIHRGSTESEISSALSALVTIPARSATEMLQHAMETSSGDFQLRIALKLVARNDISGLDVVERALLYPAALPNNFLLSLAGSLAGLKDPRAIPMLERLLGTNDPHIIKGVAIALRQSKSADALEPLSRLLNGSDEQVRYYAVVGLGEITGQDEWTPAFDEFRTHEAKYLSHWREWAASNVQKEPRK